jgi:diacylglycerol kinase
MHGDIDSERRFQCESVATGCLACTALFVFVSIRDSSSFLFPFSSVFIVMVMNRAGWHIADALGRA